MFYDAFSLKQSRKDPVKREKNAFFRCCVSEKNTVLLRVDIRGWAAKNNFATKILKTYFSRKSKSFVFYITFGIKENKFLLTYKLTTFS